MTIETPERLALELGISQKRIRDYLRKLYGTLPDGTSRWELDEHRAENVRNRFRSKASTEPTLWFLEPGDTVRRRKVHDVYGGQEQGGISTPRSIKQVLVFTDPEKGAQYGYDKFEGLREDGSYAYTGEGQHGDQVFLRGNKALRDSASEGRTIRVLRTRGVNATYVGEFTTGEPTYELKRIPDVDGIPRQGIIFNLVPISASIGLLPRYGGDTETPAPNTPAVLDERPWTPPEFSDVVILQNEQTQAGERVVSRVEFELQSDFGSWLRAKGTPPSRLRLDAGSTYVEPDLFVPEQGWIVEAKKSSARAYVRTAIGQVLDYAHLAEKSGLNVKPIVLLPGAPEPDLVELMANLGITMIVRNGKDFKEVSPGKYARPQLAVGTSPVGAQLCRGATGR